MTAVGLGQQGFQAVGPGASLCRFIFFHDFNDICQELHSNGSHGTHRSAPLRFFSVLGDKKIPMEKRDTPPHIHIYFHIISFLKHKGHSYIKFRNCETKKNSPRNCETSPPLIHINFRTRSFLKQRRVPSRSFSILGVKQVSAKPWYPLNLNFFWHENISETPGTPKKLSGTVIQKISDGKSWYPPPTLIPNFFPHRNFPETRQGSLTKFSDTVRL